MTLNPQPGAQHQQHLGSSSTRLTLRFGMLCLMSAALVSGCVSSGEYEAEKARALNFQRLLAQEEQRTGELDNRLQEAQQEITSLDSQNRELAVERDSLRDQAGRQQKRAPASDVPGTSSDMGMSPDMSFSDPSLSEFELSDFSFDESDFNDLGMENTDATGLDTPTMGTQTYYTVVQGDTLYRISRTYGVTVAQLKQWNNLTDNIISIGQGLLVSRP